MTKAAFLRVYIRLSYLCAGILVAGIFLSIQGLPAAGYVSVALIALGIVANQGPNVRRLHDRGLSGWLVCVSAATYGASFWADHAEGGMSYPLIALFGAALCLNLWLFVEMFFRRGKVGTNRYGPDPRAPR